jgi:predicted RNA-binding protein (virulence factor B family)
MYVAGRFYTLKINRESSYGQYLVDDETEEVLLPNRYVAPGTTIGDEARVFVHHDSEDRLVATTETPLVVPGQAAYLRVVDKTIHGAFLDWGLAKDLFLPVRNMIGRVEKGGSYVVFVYVDSVTGRITATAKLNSFIRNEELAVRPGDEVEILVALDNPLGYRVIVNNRHWAMLYKNQVFSPIALGDKLKAHVRRITDDQRIDVALQQQGYGEVKDAADRLKGLLEAAGGTLSVSDGSTPESVHALTGMSKKVFKRSAGYLMKQGLLEIGDGTITLKTKK